MISIVAAVPRQPQAAVILKQQCRRFGEADIALVEDATTKSLNDALQSAIGERILLFDAYSMPLGDWHRANFPQRFGILGGIHHTYGGVRAGYSFNRNAVGASRMRRLAVPFSRQYSTTHYVDIPNEGCILIRRSILDKIGFLDETLPIGLAITEFSLRARECGIEIGFDSNLSVDRDAGVIEPTLDDEARFAALRTDHAWKALLAGPAHRAELRTVHLLAHGAHDERRLQKWLQLAGYPIAQTKIVHLKNPHDIITDELRFRSRNIACVDVRAEPVQDWLLTLIEASTGDASIGIVTCGLQGSAHRLVAVDASATLIISDRIPAQICLRSDMKTFDGVVEDLCIQAAMLGTVTLSSKIHIARVNEFRERHLDTHSLEVLLKSGASIPSISFVLIAGSSASVHRYTTDAMRSYSGELAELFVAVRSDAPKITARLRNHLNVELLVDSDDELAGNAVSRALGAASGDIIVVMRDDYLVAEHWLSSMVAHLERMPKVGIVVPRISAVKGEQNCEEELFADSVEFRLAAERRRQARARAAKIVDIVQMPSFVMRRAVLEKIGGFDEVMATSHYGVIDYCIRARAAGFEIAIAEDVFVHHIPFEHTHLPHDALMCDPAYERAFAKKWNLKPTANIDSEASALLHSEIALRHRFVALQTDREVVNLPTMRNDEERVILLLPLLHENAWQQAGHLVRKYLTTFTTQDRVTLAIGRNEHMRTSLITQRIRKMIVEQALDDSLVPDIVIGNAHDRDQWLASLPLGTKHLLLADEQLPDLRIWEDCSPSGLRRAVAEAAGVGL